MDRSELVVSIIALIGTIATVAVTFFIAWMQIGVAAKHKQASQHLQDINDAVNHRHERGEGRKLYDLVWENHSKVDELIEWKRGYDGGPLSTGTKVHAFVNGTKQRLDEMQTQIEQMPCVLKHNDCDYKE